MIEIRYSCGRAWLWVNGFAVAMETDRCRDPDLHEVEHETYSTNAPKTSQAWTKEKMQAVIDAGGNSEGSPDKE